MLAGRTRLPRGFDVGLRTSRVVGRVGREGVGVVGILVGKEYFFIRTRWVNERARRGGTAVDRREGLVRIG